MSVHNKYDRRDWLGQLFSLHGSVLPQIAPTVVLLALCSWGLTWARQIREAFPEGNARL